MTCGRVELMHKAAHTVQDHNLAVYCARYQIKPLRLRHGVVPSVVSANDANIAKLGPTALFGKASVRKMAVDNVAHRMDLSA